MIWLLRIVGPQQAPTFMALTCRWRSRPQHHKLTSVPATRILGYSYAAARRLSGGHTVGALGGATVNYAFIERFQDMARGHVIVRRLERAYGKEVVRREYERLAQDS
jgi:hypothetical protein